MAIPDYKLKALMQRLQRLIEELYAAKHQLETEINEAYILRLENQVGSIESEIAEVQEQLGDHGINTQWACQKVYEVKKSHLEAQYAKAYQQMGRTLEDAEKIALKHMANWYEEQLQKLVSSL